MRRSPGGPSAAVPTQARDAVMIEKKAGFEFIQVGNLEPSASDAPQQGAQHGIFEPRGRREDNVPQIAFLVAQGHAKHAAGRAVILVTSHDARERLLAGPDAPDFDGLADAEVPVHHDRCTVLTDVRGLPFPQELFPALHGDGKMKAQIQKDSCTAAQIFFSA